MVSAAGYQDWYIGLALAFFVIVVVVVIVATILTLAARIADQATAASTGVDVVRAQTTGRWRAHLVAPVPSARQHPDERTWPNLHQERPAMGVEAPLNLSCGA